MDCMEGSVLCHGEEFHPLVPPYLYETLWHLGYDGPMTSAEIADQHNLPLSMPDYMRWSGRDVANRLRSMAKKGIVALEDGRWGLTAAGCRWMGGSR
jgi:hypothetical protein